MKHVKFPSSNHVKQETIAECSFLTRKETFFSHTPFFYFHWFSLFWKTHKLSTIFKRKKKYGYFLSFNFFFLKDNFDSIKNFWWILQICIPFYHHPLSLDRISLFCYKMVKNLCLRLWIVVSKLQSSKNWWEKNRKIWTFAVKNF